MLTAVACPFAGTDQGVVKGHVYGGLGAALARRAARFSAVARPFAGPELGVVNGNVWPEALVQHWFEELQGSLR